ncbi:MAG: ArsC/Spx/MgsR family protein [Acidimicrobiales bacterium]
MKTPPARADLERILDLLPDEPTALIRRDKSFETLGLTEADCQAREQVVDLLLAHPELMQRPVIIRGDRAVIARPAEKVLELL